MAPLMFIIVNMLITKEKFLIKIFFTLEATSANQLESLQQRQECRQRLQVIVKAMSYWVSRPDSSR